MRDIKDIKDANIAIRELQDQIRTLTTSVVDFKGRKISNAAPSREPSDYVIRQELTTLATELNDKLIRLTASLDFLEKRVKALEP